MLEKIKAPFTEEEVKKLNAYQKSGTFHAFTCIGQPYVPKKHGVAVERSRKACPNDGMLIATSEGWVCPCGKCTQTWAYNFMIEDIN